VLAAFRTIFFFAIFLCLVSAGLVLGSIFIEDRAPQTTLFLGITLAVGGVFLTLGLLLFGTQRHVSGIVRGMRSSEEPVATGVEVHVFRLLLYLSLGGAGLCGILAVMAYAILARIDQGFAVFG
jgi:hypothetical protein